MAAGGAWASEPLDRLAQRVAVSKFKRSLRSLKGKLPSDDAATVRAYFEQYDGLEHLRVRQRADLLIIESGPANDPIPHARLRRLAAQFWALEMSTHVGRWQPTPDNGKLPTLLQRLVERYPWILAPRE